MVGVGCDGWRRGAVRGVALAGALVFSGAALAACAGSPKATKTFTPTATGAAGSSAPAEVDEYQPATETSPAKNVPVPKYPEAAKANTVAGQKAFIEYWFKTYNYAMDTGDGNQLENISDNSCRFCRFNIEKVREMYLDNKTWRVGGEAKVIINEANRGPYTERTQPWDVPVEEEAVRFFDKNGVSKKYDASQSTAGLMRIWIARDDELWRVHEVATVDGTEK